MLRGALVVMVAAGVLAASAEAANQPHPTLDAIASEVAGYPATVWCEADEASWLAILSSRGVASTVLGFAALDERVAYIAPSACLPLAAALRDPTTADGHLGVPLHVLLHESVHLRGIRDEGETDCTALALIKEYAVRYFGFAETVAAKRRVMRWRWAKRKAWIRRDGERIQVVRRVRVRVARTVTVRVPNPELEGLYSAAYAEYLLRSVQAPEYRGDC